MQPIWWQAVTYGIRGDRYLNKNVWVELVSDRVNIPHGIMHNSYVAYHDITET